MTRFSFAFALALGLVSVSTATTYSLDAHAEKRSGPDIGDYNRKVNGVTAAFNTAKGKFEAIRGRVERAENRAKGNGKVARDAAKEAKAQFDLAEVSLEDARKLINAADDADTNADGVTQLDAAKVKIEEVKTAVTAAKTALDALDEDVGVVDKPSASAAPADPCDDPSFRAKHGPACAK